MISRVKILPNYCFFSYLRNLWKERARSLYPSPMNCLHKGNICFNTHTNKFYRGIIICKNIGCLIFIDGSEHVTILGLRIYFCWGNLFN